MGENKFLNFLKSVGNEIKDTVLNKWLDCFVGLAALLITVAQAITYSFMPHDIYNSNVIAYCVAGILLYVLLSLFKQTSPLAPVALMIFDFLCIAGMANADGMIDYVTTQFFSGISLEAIFSLPTAVWLSLFLFIVSFITSSVAMYMPKSRKPRENKDGGAPAENAAEGEAK